MPEWCLYRQSVPIGVSDIQVEDDRMISTKVAKVSGVGESVKERSLFDMINSGTKLSICNLFLCFVIGVAYFSF